jgi:hypothetical protein
MTLRRRQRGAALMAMLAILILGMTWWAVTALNTPVDRNAQDRAYNARILQEAKSALIGYVAHHAAMTTENDPGRLPCPEALGNIGTTNEGVAAGNCTLPAIGRLPWRTLGIDKWRDVAGEPLWYVVSPGWTKPNAATNTVINSNSTGQLTLDGNGDVVALIIAPGRPLQIDASAGCTARVQRRTTPAPTIDFRDYLDCENASSPVNATFVSTGTSASFNDQVLQVTGAEMLPGIEAAVATRFERQFAAQIRTAYSTGSWPANPALPFAATFANPATSSFKGAAATFSGLMPVSFSETAPASGVACNPAAAGVRCDPDFVRWTSGNLAGAGINSSSCTVSDIIVGGVVTGSSLDCTFYRKCLLICAAGTIPFTFNGTASNVGMTLRQLNDATAMTNVNVAPRASSAVLNANGSATVTLNAEADVGGGVGFSGALGDLLCGVLALLQVCKQESISVPIRILADHPVLDSTDATYNWFFRNNWHQVSWYAVAPDIAPSGPRACGANCLTVGFRTPSTNQRGLIVIAGRNLTGAAWPAVTASDWLESTNNDSNLTYAVRDPTLMVRRTFNDRIAVIDP